MFTVGQKVKWSSQAGSFEKEKRGTILAVIPVGGIIKRFVRDQINPGEHYSARKYREAFDFSGMYRDHESYIVEVPTKTGRGRSTLYWPRVSHLQLDND